MTTSDAINSARQVYIIGNGGSHANAMHIANDLLSRGIKAFTMDPATLTAFANDFGYENALAKWLAVVGEPGDLLIALSGSGRSKNILAAVAVAQTKGLSVIKLFGAELGQDMQQAEEQQLVWGHDMWRQL